MGTDRFGNQYFENRRAQSQRFRWVKYKDQLDYSANDVPPEWFSWLHALNDWPPGGKDTPPGVYPHPTYERPPTQSEAAACLDQPISSFKPAVYMPKGYPKRQGGRWPVEEIIERWDPAAATTLQRAEKDTQQDAASLDAGLAVPPGQRARE